MARLRIFVAAVAALLFMGVTAQAGPPPEKEFTQRVEELVRWISSKSNYPATLRQMPEFVFLPPQTIRQAFSRSMLGYSDQTSSVRAVQVKGTIYLPDTFQVGADDYMLMHELVHHMQDESGEKFGCVAEREREAYLLQAQFVEETGAGEAPNDMFMLMLRCDIR
jgi:hypothetical protein